MKKIKLLLAPINVILIEKSDSMILPSSIINDNRRGRDISPWYPQYNNADLKHEGYKYFGSRARLNHLILRDLTFYHFHTNGGGWNLIGFSSLKNKKIIGVLTEYISAHESYYDAAYVGKSFWSSSVGNGWVKKNFNATISWVDIKDMSKYSGLHVNNIRAKNTILIQAIKVTNRPINKMFLKIESPILGSNSISSNEFY